MDIILHTSTIITAVFLMILLKSQFILLLSSNGFSINNYRGKETVYGAGLIFLIPCMVSVLPLWSIIAKGDLYIYQAMLLAMTFMGYLDDSLGDHTRKGFKNHFYDLVTGHPSTGIFKIIFALIIGLIISKAYYSSIMDIIFHILLFGLCVNFINLLDLRPGRAIKGFVFLTLIICLLSGLKSLWILLPIFSGLTVYIKDEMDEKCMLGDTGSNLLGGILGMYTLNAGGLWTKYGLFMMLLILHFAAEFISFSRIIESNPILKQIDRHGQLKRGGP